MFDKVIFVDDFHVTENNGGAELVNAVVQDYLKCEFIKSTQLTKFTDNNFYILGNISLMHPTLLNTVLDKKYIILEHDYKICASRHPWRYPDNIVPSGERINYDLYKNAKAVFVQTSDHLSIFKLNGVEANFINLESTLWSKKDLSLLRELKLDLKEHTYAIVESDNWIKNTKGAVEFCKNNNLDYKLIQGGADRKKFLSSLASLSTLVFFPIARESCCRLVVDARCLNMNVITSKNYGAALEEWFSKSGDELITLLEYNTTRNLSLIEESIYED